MTLAEMPSVVSPSRYSIKNGVQHAPDLATLHIKQLDNGIATDIVSQSSQKSFSSFVWLLLLQFTLQEHDCLGFDPRILPEGIAVNLLVFPLCRSH